MDEPSTQNAQTLDHIRPTPEAQATMSNRKPLIFSKSCLALAVVTLSACSSNPVQNDSAIGTVSDTLSRAGMKTRDLSVSAWDKTIYLLGFSDVNPDDAQIDDKTNDQLLDEVDLALLEVDAILPPDFFLPASDIVVVASPDELQTPIAFPVPFQTPTKAGERPDTETSGLQTPTATMAELQAPVESNLDGKKIDAVDDMTAVSIADATSVIPEASTSLIADENSSDGQYFHEVASSQTLWDIAKSTTGDANNWHTIADVNDLIQSTSLYPGQRLLIPTDLVKADLLPAKSDSDYKTPTQGSGLATTAAVANPAKPELSTAARKIEEDVGVLDSSADSTPDSTPDSIASAAGLGIPSEAGTTAEPELAASNVDVTQDHVQLALGQGESLWDFARRTTGDATNWESIATHNGMDDAAARLVYPGQMITVPSAMLRKDGPTSEAPKAASTPAMDTSPDVASASEATSQGGSSAPEFPEGDTLRIVEAAYQAEPATPATNSADFNTAEEDVATKSSNQGEVIVSGTYYPKAVYHDTNFSAPLLMRVSPGTRLQVSQIDGPWLQVQTERGVGYLHQRDIR